MLHWGQSKAGLQQLGEKGSRAMTQKTAAQEQTEWLSIRDVSRLVGVHWFSVQRWIWAQKLAAVKFGRFWRVSPQSLKSFLRARSNYKQ